VTERRSYSRHGLNVVKARVMVRGLAAIDKRTAAAQALIGWRNELLSDLGGQESVSAQQLALIDMAVRTRLYIDHLDCWLMEQGTLINKRRKAVFPVLRERQSLVDSLSRVLGQLGLERRPKPIPALSEYVAERYGDNGSEAESENAARQGGAE
jgi:hypothetical protein